MSPRKLRNRSCRSLGHPNPRICSNTSIRTKHGCRTWRRARRAIHFTAPRTTKLLCPPQPMVRRRCPICQRAGRIQTVRRSRRCSKACRPKKGTTNPFGANKPGASSPTLPTCQTNYKTRMETSTPGNKRLHNISEVSCPDSCNQSEQEKGCHFRMGPDRFTCTKCQLRIWRHFMAYELTPTDLQEMLHGEKITSSEKTLTWKKDGKETTIRGRLLLNEGYKVRIAPKLKSKQITDEACPKCKTRKLQLITAIDDSKWYGCDGD